MIETVVTLEQLANDLGVSRSNARKIAIRVGRDLGFEPVKRQVNGVGRWQRVLTWTQSEAKKIVLHRRNEGFIVRS